MNLEFDTDEQALLAQVETVFRGVAPVEAGGGKAVWGPLVAAGWTELGASIEDGTLDLGLAAGVFRLAGRQLLVEQLVSSGYVLSALAARCRDDADRAAFTARLAERPGVLLGDGRDSAVPVVGPDVTDGYCFGVEGEVDAYRVVTTCAGELTLARWSGATVVRHTPPLSAAVGSLTVVDGEWLGGPVDVDAAGLERIRTNAVLLHSAALVGVGEALLTVTRDYTLTRVQFGAPIGSYQAVKHALADVFAGNTVAWNAVLSAVAEGADEVTAPLAARYLAVEAALGSARAGAQFHGGMGFTAELSVHRYLKAVLDGGQRFGSHDEFAAALSREVVGRAC